MPVPPYFLLGDTKYRVDTTAPNAPTTKATEKSYTCWYPGAEGQWIFAKLPERIIKVGIPLTRSYYDAWTPERIKEANADDPEFFPTEWRQSLVEPSQG